MNTHVLILFLMLSLMLVLILFLILVLVLSLILFLELFLILFLILFLVLFLILFLVLSLILFLVLSLILFLMLFLMLMLVLVRDTGQYGTRDSLLLMLLISFLVTKKRQVARRKTDTPQICPRKTGDNKPPGRIISNRAAYTACCIVAVV